MNKNSTFFKYHFYKFQIKIFVDFIPYIFLSQIIVCLSMLFSSIQFISSVVSDSLRSHELQHARPPCPSPTPRVHSNLCPLGWWCHPAILSSVIPFSSCLQSYPAWRSFPMSWLFLSGSQRTRVSASPSYLSVNIVYPFP